MFGRPREGVHAPRIGGLAAFDLLGTAAAAALIGYWRGSGFLELLAIFAVLMLAGVLAHRAFCVDTALNVAIFGQVRRPAARARISRAHNI